MLHERERGTALRDWNQHHTGVLAVLWAAPTKSLLYRPGTERPYLSCVNMKTHKCRECHVRRPPKPCEHEPVSVSWLSALGIAYASLDTCNSDIAEYQFPQFPSRPFSFLEEGPVMDWKSSLGVLSQQLLPEWCQVGTVPQRAALSTVSSGIFISAIITMPLWVAPTVPFDVATD